MFLIYGEGNLVESMYINASFQSDRDESKSQSGYVFTLNGVVANWKSSNRR